MTIKNLNSFKKNLEKKMTTNARKNVKIAVSRDTGFLGQNITMNVKSLANGSIVGQVISAAPYSKALEFGTTKMDARPFMQPALEKNKKKIVSIFKQHGVIT